MRRAKMVLASALCTVMLSANATPHGSLAASGNTMVHASDIEALFAREGIKTADTARFSSATQAKQLIEAILLVLHIADTGADAMRLSNEERSRLKIVTAKAKLENLLEISDQRVEEAARRNPALYDQRVQEVYETATEQFIAPKKAKAAHILLRTDRRTIAEAASFAEQLVWRARSGESFELLAKQYSDDERTKDQGGVLGEYADSKKGDHPIEIAIFWTKRENNIADPVLGRSGIHVVKVLSETPSGRATLKEATPAIKLALIAQQKVLERRKWSQVFTDAVSKATYNDDEILKLVAPAETGDREKIENALKQLGVGGKSGEQPKTEK